MRHHRGRARRTKTGAALLGSAALAAMVGPGLVAAASSPPASSGSPGSVGSVVTSFDGTCTISGNNGPVAFTKQPEVQFSGNGTCTGSVDGAPASVHPAVMDLYYDVIPTSSQQPGQFLAVGPGGADISFADLCSLSSTCNSMLFEVAEVGGLTPVVAVGLGYVDDPNPDHYGPDSITFHTVGPVVDSPQAPFG